MANFILIMLMAIVGVILFIISAGFIIYKLYKGIKRGYVKFVILLITSILLMCVTFGMGIYTIVSKENARKSAKTNKVIDTYYTLSKEQRDILDNKTYEEATNEERLSIITAAVFNFEKKEDKKYESKVRDFCIKYYEELGYTSEMAINMYNTQREGAGKLSRGKDTE